MRNRSPTVRGHLSDPGVELTGALPGRLLDGPEELRGRPEPLRPTSDG